MDIKRTTPHPDAELIIDTTPHLPEGSTGMPSVFWTDPSQQQPQADPDMQRDYAVDQDTVVTPGIPESLLQEIRQYPLAKQELILAWFPHIHMQPSQYLDGHYVMTVPQILIHAEAYQKDQLLQQREQADIELATKRAKRQERSAADDKFAADYEDWQTQCTLRKQWIEGKKEEWRKRVAQRNELMAQWNAYVEAARNEYQEAKAYPIPPRPTRV